MGHPGVWWRLGGLKRLVAVMFLGWGTVSWAAAGPGAKAAACRVGVVEGELQAGREFSAELGDGLKVWFQPIASGWILRVIPDSGSIGAHDYAELATPPYASVSPLSVSTDFSFRAQDAVGWNPRRFRYAASAAEFARLQAAYDRFERGGAKSGGAAAELAAEVAKAADGKLTIVDAKLVPGMADQWRMAGAVSNGFETTAHTLVQSADGRPSPLGKLVWLRFRVELWLPAGFRAARGLRVDQRVCGAV